MARARRSFEEKQTEYEDLKRRAHQKVDELTRSQLRKFLASYWRDQKITTVEVTQ